MIDDHTTYEAGAPGDEPRAPSAFVAVLGEGSTGIVELAAGTEVSIGRSRSSGIPIEDRAASRLHATLRWDGGPTVHLTDHGSRNGTYVEGERVRESIDLPSGAEVRIGETRLVIAVRAQPVQPSQLAAAGEAQIEEADLVAHDPAMLRVVALAERAGRTNANVLLVGETGAGKEVIARRIHALGARSSGPFVAVNCGSITDTLAESILFGHERGAFTGAIARKEGVFEAASGGTLFLDEIGELTPAMQVRLLRVLEERKVTRLGSTDPIPVDVRIVAATHRDLDTMAKTNAFRRDLLYRLDVLRIAIPPLRQRPADIAALARKFVRDLEPSAHVVLAADAIEALRARAWPGNVRELRNVIERALALREGDLLRARDLEATDDTRARVGEGSLRTHLGHAERDAILEALEACGGNRSRAARRLGISRRAFLYKLEKYGLKPPPASDRE